MNREFPEHPIDQRIDGLFRLESRVKAIKDRCQEAIVDFEDKPYGNMSPDDDRFYEGQSILASEILCILDIGPEEDYEKEI